MPTPRKHADHAARQSAYRQRVSEAMRQRETSAPAPAPTPAPSPARWLSLIRRAQRLLQAVQEEMEAYYEQRTDRWQASERGEAFLERLQGVQDAQTAAEELCS